MKVLVVYEWVGRDMRFVMIAKGETVNMISKIHTLLAVSPFGKMPDDLFGDACSCFTGGCGYEITTTCIEWGSLEGWVDS